MSAKYAIAAISILLKSAKTKLLAGPSRMLEKTMGMVNRIKERPFTSSSGASAKTNITHKKNRNSEADKRPDK
ncbi:MAG: hypothetical protein HZB19_04310 [Chloroflexi bacterium]|nr:hypothetical protein [Chloroflexota bacterium]